MIKFIRRFIGQEVHVNPPPTIKEKRALLRALRIIQALEQGNRSGHLKEEMKRRIDYLRRRGLNVKPTKESVLEHLERHR